MVFKRWMADRRSPVCGKRKAASLRFLGLLLASALTAALLGGCGISGELSGGGSGESGSDSPARRERSFFAMDTVMSFAVYGDEDALAAAEAAVTDLEAQVSATIPESAIAVLNRDHAAELSPAAADVLSFALDLCARTKGALDITVYPAVEAWGFVNGENQETAFAIPDFDTTDALSERIDYTQIRLDGTSASLPEGMAADLGAVAKGYAGREAARILRERGITSALLNLGGNVQTVGAKPDGSAWKVAIQNPEKGQDPSSYAGILEIADRAAVTSGGYQRYFTGSDGQIYWHILDPETARPARSGLLSATVVAEDGALCDALSTALFVMGPEKAVRFWQRNRDLEFGMVLITEEGEAIVTPDLAYTPDPSAPFTLRVLEEA